MSNNKLNKSALTKCPARWWLHLQDIVSLVINRNHVVARVGSTVGLVLQTALLCVQLHLQNKYTKLQFQTWVYTR